MPDLLITKTEREDKQFHFIMPIVRYSIILHEADCYYISQKLYSNQSGGLVNPNNFRQLLRLLHLMPQISQIFIFVSITASHHR